MRAKEFLKEDVETYSVKTDAGLEFPCNDLDHARNKARSLLSYKKADKVYILKNGKAVYSWQLNIPLEPLDESKRLNESADEEAWELVGQPVPEIQQFVKELGFSKDKKSVAKIAPMIDATPDTQIPAASIPKLKNLANKGNDVQTLKAIQQISGGPDAAQQYAKLMQARDAGEGRKRDYDVSKLIDIVKSGNYPSPVLLKLATGIYVIGGRTRLYAALALGVPAKVKVISSATFAKQSVQESEARLEPEVEEFLHGLTPDDVGHDTVGNYIIHYEGFTDQCQDTKEYQENPEAVFDEVWSDFRKRMGGQKPVNYGVVGEHDYPIVYSVFRRN
jgi:hypothetical protein